MDDWGCITGPMHVDPKKHRLEDCSVDMVGKVRQSRRWLRHVLQTSLIPEFPNVIGWVAVDNPAMDTDIWVSQNPVRRTDD